MFEYQGILGLLILFADIYAILQIAQSSASTGKKALWIVVVVVLPVVGLILWYLLGPKP
jgi:succinate dehydrogenase/fumarate reductase cytochrome b subunit